MAIKPEFVGECVVNNILYNNMDYGGRGNCLFLAIAGSLRAVKPSSVEDHISLRAGVSVWYIEYGEYYQQLIGGLPSDVIIDNPNQPPYDIFEMWSWADGGRDIAIDGIWGGFSKLIALNAVFGNGYKVNIFDNMNGAAVHKQP